MAYLHIQMESRSLQMPVPLDVILPEYDPDGKDGTSVKGPYKTLYLLHGFRGSQSDWVINSNILRYVQNLPFAVVMPAGNNSFYVNTLTGQSYTDYLAWELPAICEDWFHLSSKREDRYIAGYAMGGYGSFHTAMTYPERFSKAVSMSGVLDASRPYNRMGYYTQAVNMMGPLEELEGGPNDLVALASSLKKLPETQIPQFLSVCGGQDILWEVNTTFQRHMEELEIPVKFETWEGKHDWKFWDEAIVRVLEWLEIRKEG